MASIGGPAQLPGIPSHESQKIAPPSQLTILVKQSKEDSKTDHTQTPNPVTPTPTYPPLCPIDCVKLTRESVISPMLGHKEMGGECPSVGKIGVTASVL
jgi:hypothetical protein